MGRDSLTEEQVRLVLKNTYQYWDGYYFPDSTFSNSGWTEEKIIEIILKDIENTP